MQTRLKGLTAALICAAALGAAATAEAQPTHTTNGTVQRCIAAVNGNHYGFDCEPNEDTAYYARCPDGYSGVSTGLSPGADLNGNTVVCLSSSGDFTDDGRRR